MKATFDGGGCFPTGRHYPGIAHLVRIVTVGIADEFSGDSALSELALVAVDTETTGRDPAVDRVIEVGCVVYRGGEIVGRHGWLINPGCPIPEDATAVHGIKNEDVQDAPDFATVLPEILEVMSGCIPVAYNAAFDRDFLMAEIGRTQTLGQALPPAARKGVEWFDPLVWAREIHKEEKSKALGEVCERLGIRLERAHRATDDAEAALCVLNAFALDSRVPKTYAAFIQEQRRLAKLFEQERVRWRN